MAIIVYTVNKGDTLHNIAEKFGSSVNAIARCQWHSSTFQNLSRPKFKNTRFDEPNFITYTVQPGDTLYSLAEYFGTIGR